MPASSRKRNKGKERKAKKEGIEKARVRNLWQGWIEENSCDHGCAAKVPDDHLVHSFMDLLFANAMDMVLYEIMFCTYQKYPEVWNDNIHRQMVLNIMSIIGTNMLLKGDYQARIWAIFISQCIMSIEHYNGTGIGPVINCRAVTKKRRDFDLDCSSLRRDLLKFYRKRTSCKCLKKLHLNERKNTSKMGLCWGCEKEYERVSLSVCSRCMVDQYCSRECQIAHWPRDKKDCDMYVRAHKAMT